MRLFFLLILLFPIGALANSSSKYSCIDQKIFDSLVSDAISIFESVDRVTGNVSPAIKNNRLNRIRKILQSKRSKLCRSLPSISKPIEPKNRKLFCPNSTHNYLEIGCLREKYGKQKPRSYLELVYWSSLINQADSYDSDKNKKLGNSDRAVMISSTINYFSTEHYVNSFSLLKALKADYFADFIAAEKDIKTASLMYVVTNSKLDIEKLKKTKKRISGIVHTYRKFSTGEDKDTYKWFISAFQRLINKIDNEIKVRQDTLNKLQKSI